jgi:hypothetical protein
MRSHVLPLGALGVIGLIYAWPLVSQLTTAIPGGPQDRDVATMVWNVGWVHHVLVSGGNPLRADDVLVPFGADLRLHTYGLLQGLVAAPFVAFLGVVGAYNLVLLATLLLNGGLTYVLVERYAGSRPAAVLAATSLMLAGPVLAQIRVGRPTFASLWIVAAALLALNGMLSQPTLARAIGLGVLLVAALLTDFQIVLFTAIWLTVYATYRVGRDLRQLQLGRVVLAGSLAVAIFLVPFRLVFYPAFGISGLPTPGLDDVQTYSFSYSDYLMPEMIPYAYGHEFLGGIIAAPILFGRSKKPYLVWLVGAVICLVLALGPVLQPTDVSLPFSAVGSWAPLGQFRTPSRLAQPAVLGLTVVLGLAVARLEHRWRGAPLLIAVAVVARLVFAMVHDPFAVQTYPEYTVYQRIAQEPGRFTLLEVPFGVRSGLERIGSGAEVLEYYQAIHEKPVLNAMIARLPTTVFDVYRSHPVLRFLSGEDVTNPTEVLAHDLLDVLEWTNTHYVLLHRSLSTSEQADRWQGFLDAQPRLEHVETEYDLVVYRVRRS